MSTLARSFAADETFHAQLTSTNSEEVFCSRFSIISLSPPPNKAFSSFFLSFSLSLSEQLFAFEHAASFFVVIYGGGRFISSDPIRLLAAVVASLAGV